LLICLSTKVGVTGLNVKVSVFVNFERTIFDQLSSFFENHFHPFLSAFRSGHGCQTALLKIIEVWNLLIKDVIGPVTTGFASLIIFAEIPSKPVAFFIFNLFICLSTKVDVTGLNVKVSVFVLGLFVFIACILGKMCWWTKVK
jgi:hypothetical protein